MEKTDQSPDDKSTKKGMNKERMFGPPAAATIGALLCQQCCAQAVPVAMVALFIVNMQVWIGDKECYVAGGAAYTVPAGVVTEVDVAAAWKTWSLCGAIFWGAVVLANAS